MVMFDYIFVAVASAAAGYFVPKAASSVVTKVKAYFAAKTAAVKAVVADVKKV
jgi:hypothetical protein